MSNQATITLILRSCTALLFLFSPNVLAESKENTHSRRSFFGKIRDAYIQGRLESNEKRIYERREAEKVRRRAVFERNVKSLVDGVSRRLKRGPNQFKLLVVGGVILVIWLCHRGSVGCNRHEEKPSSNHYDKGSDITVTTIDYLNYRVIYFEDIYGEASYTLDERSRSDGDAR